MFHRAARILLEAVAVLIVLAIAAAGLAAWRLSQGPVSVAALTSLIDHALEDALPGYLVDLEDTVLVWGGWERGIDVRVRGARLLTPQGKMIVEVPEASVRLSAASLLRARVDASRVEVHGATLKIERDADGSIGLAGAPASTGAGEGLLDTLEKGAGGEASLREILFTGVEIEFADLVTGAVWRAREGFLMLTRDGDSTALSADLALERRERAARVSLRALHRGSANRIDVSASVANFAAELLSDQDPALARLAGLDLAIAAQVRAQLDGDGRILGAEVDATAGAGRFTDPALFPQPVTLKALRASGRYARQTGRIEVTSLDLELDGPRIEAKAVFERRDGASELRANARARAVPVDSLQWLWPLPAAPNARAWVTQNLSQGRAEEAQIEVVMRGPEPAALTPVSLAGEVKVAGVTVNYLAPMPRVVGAAGVVKLGLDRVDIVTNAGAVGALRVEEARIAFTQLSGSDERAEIDLRVRGPVRDQMQLIDSPPLGYPRQVGLNSADFSGDALTRVRLAFPLIGRLKVEQIQVAGASEVKAFGLKRAALGQDIRDGDLAVKFDDKALGASGKLTLGRTPAEAEYTMNFQSSAPVQMKVRASGRMPAGELAAFGFDLAPYVQGPMPVTVDYTLRRGGQADVGVEAGLDQATLAFADLNWSKPPGVPGSARLELLVQRDRLVEIRNARVAAGNADGAGRVRFAADGSTIMRADIDRLRIGRSNLRAVVTREGRGFRMQLNGPLLDLSDVDIEFGGDETATAKPRPPLSVEARIDRVTLTPQRQLLDVNFEGQRGASWERAQLTAKGTGRDGQSAPFNASLATDAGGRKVVRARTQNAGAMLRSFGVTDQIVGGHLEIDGATDEAQADKPIALNIKMRDYRLVEEPAIARFLAIALLTGIADSLRGEGIGFDRLDGRAFLRGSVVEIANMRASGPALGVQARGKVDIGDDKIDMEGTIVPANAVNSLLGRIPVVGEVLFGPGLFAARYTVRGPRSAPDITINPLSALAPGILRNIFGILDGGGATPGAVSPQSDRGQSDR
jgi:uncharacterized protein YhdP